MWSRVCLDIRKYINATTNELICKETYVPRAQFLVSTYLNISKISKCALPLTNQGGAPSRARARPTQPHQRARSQPGAQGGGNLQQRTTRSSPCSPPPLFLAGGRSGGEQEEQTSTKKPPPRS